MLYNLTVKGYSVACRYWLFLVVKYDKLPGEKGQVTHTMQDSNKVSWISETYNLFLKAWLFGEFTSSRSSSAKRHQTNKRRQPLGFVWERFCCSRVVMT